MLKDPKGQECMVMSSNPTNPIPLSGNSWVTENTTVKRRFKGTNV